MNKAEIKIVDRAVTKIYQGGSLRVADEKGLGIDGAIAEYILRGPTLWHKAERALVFVDDPEKFIRSCYGKRRYLVGEVDLRVFCHNDRDGWNKSLEIGRRLDQVISGRASGSNRQLGLVVVGNLQKVREIDYDYQTNFAFLARYSKEPWNDGRRGSLSVLAFDDTESDGDRMFEGLRGFFGNRITVSQEPIEE